MDRIWQCHYPQLMADILPIPGGEESLLRFDHIQPIGMHHDSIELTPFCLSEDALEVINEWISWLITGELVEDGWVDQTRKHISGHV